MTKIDRPGGALPPAAAHPPVARSDSRPPEGGAAARAPAVRRAEGLAGVADSRSGGRTNKLRKAAAKNRGEGAAELRPVGPPSVSLNTELTQGAESFAANVEALGLSHLVGPAASGVDALSNVAPEALLSLFLNLNVTDPNNSPETHDMLYELASNLRQQAIDEASAKMALARELIAEAEKALADLQAISTAVTVVTVIIMVIITIVTAVVTLGAGAAPMGGATAAAGGSVGGGVTAGAAAAQGTAQASAQTLGHAAQASTQQTVAKIIQAITAAILAAIQIPIAVAQHQAQNEAADSRGVEVDANRQRQQADEQQQVVEDEAAILQTLLESKNAVVEAVTHMLNAQLDTASRAMSQGMVR